MWWSLKNKWMRKIKRFICIKNTRRFFILVVELIIVGLTTGVDILGNEEERLQEVVMLSRFAV